MKKGDTWLPLYVGDYLADTMHLTGPDHGAYLLLLMHSWRTGPLRDDERALAAVARTDLATFREMWPTLREFFVPQDGAPGFLISPRLERERERAAQHIDQRRAAGKASAEARARQRESNGRSTGVARPLEREGRPSPSPTYPSDTGAADAAPAETPITDQLWHDGLAILRDLTGKAESSCRAFLGKMRKAARDDDAVVLATIRAGREASPADPEAWLMRAVQARQGPPQKAPPGPAELPAEVAGYRVPAVIDGVLDALDVGDLRFPDLGGVVVGLLREGYEPDALYATAGALRRRGAVEGMRSATYFAKAVRGSERDRREQSQERPFNLDTLA